MTIGNFDSFETPQHQFTPGAQRLRDNATLERLIRDQHAKSKSLAAICAAPVVILDSLGLIGEQSATAFPAYATKLGNQAQVWSAINSLICR